MTQVGEQSPSATEQVREKVQEGVSQAQDLAKEAKGQAGSRLRDQIDSRSTQMGEQTSSVAQAVRRTGKQLREEDGNDLPARVLEGGAERLERLGGYLTQSNADRILQDIEDFGRRQPWLVALGGAVIGLAASRLLKASSQGRYQGHSGVSSLTARSGAYVPPADRGLPVPVHEPGAPA